MLCGPFIRWHHAVNLRWQGQCPKNIGRLPKEQAFSARHYCARSKHTNARPEGPLKPQVRLERINSRLPKFLREYTKPLINAPLSHVSAFLLLHELTAIIPLLTLAGAFHYTQWTPSLIGEWQWAAEGVEKFGGYFRRKGWLQKENDKVEEGRKSSSNSQSRTKIVLEFAAAYAVCKALLPFRLMLSVWSTPWFARVAIIPGRNLLQRVVSRVMKN